MASQIYSVPKRPDQFLSQAAAVPQRAADEPPGLGAVETTGGAAAVAASDVMVERQSGAGSASGRGNAALSPMPRPPSPTTSDAASAATCGDVLAPFLPPLP